MSSGMKSYLPVVKASALAFFAEGCILEAKVVKDIEAVGAYSSY